MIDGHIATAPAFYTAQTSDQEDGGTRDNLGRKDNQSMFTNVNIVNNGFKFDKCVSRNDAIHT